MREIGFIDIGWETFPGNPESIPDSYLQTLRIDIEKIEHVDLRRRHRSQIISISKRQEEFGATQVLFALSGVKGIT